MTEKRFVERYAGRTIKKLIGIEDIETNRVCVTIEENIHLLNELADENKELKEENEQSKMMIATLRNIILENEDLEKENKELREQLKDCTKKAKEEIRKQAENDAIKWANIGR